MHRPGIARIVGDQVILDGTTIEEVQDYHASTLALVVNATNERAEEIRAQQHRKEARDAEHREEHQRRVDDIAKSITFE